MLGMNNEKNDNVEQNAEPKSLQGSIPELASDSEVLAALEEAFDYRGDVTVTLKDGKVVEGYVFDRRKGQRLDDSIVRILPQGSDERVTIKYSEIEGLTFSGKDAAHGKTWENWVKRFVEKKSKGEAANLEPEKLD